MTTDNSIQDIHKTLEIIAKDLKEIKKNLNPPLWQKFIYFFLEHFLLLAVLGLLSYISWEIWVTVSSIQDSVNHTFSYLENIKATTVNKLNSWKFW